jgi:hypothetical protein
VVLNILVFLEIVRSEMANIVWFLPMTESVAMMVVENQCLLILDCCSYTMIYYFITHPILLTTTFARGSPDRRGFAKHIGHFLNLLQISGHCWLLKTIDTSD